MRQRRRLPWLVASSSLVWLACSTREDYVERLCSKVTACEAEYKDQSKNQAGAQSQYSALFKKSCVTSIEEQLDLEQLTDVQLIKCRRCVLPKDQDRSCDEVYRARKCDDMCEGTKWVTGPKTTFQELSSICEYVTDTCYTQAAGLSDASVESSAEAGGASCPDATHSSTAGAAGRGTAASVPNEVVQRCGWAIQAYLWGGEGDSSSRGGGGTKGSRASGMSDESVLSATPAIDEVAADVVRGCVSCLTALRSEELSCDALSTACISKCASVPEIGSHLTNTPAAYLCGAVFDTCASYVDPVPKGHDECVDTLGSDREYPSDSLQICAQCVNELRQSGCACERLLEGACDAYCKEQLRTFLFTKSPAYMVCSQQPCKATIPKTSDCMDRVKLATAQQLSTCLSCLDDPETSCSSSAATSAMAGVAGAAGSSGGDAAVAGASAVLPVGDCEALCPVGSNAAGGAGQ